jgi:outer membrane PBP1 activator LpoA protein
MIPYPKRRRLQSLLSLGILLLAVLTASCAQSSPAPNSSRLPDEPVAAAGVASMEAVHISSYNMWCGGASPPPT